MSDYRFSGAIGIAELEPIKRELDELLNEGSDITLSSTDLEFIDGSGVQLLLAFMREAKKRGIHVCWNEISSTLQEAIQLMAVQDLFQLKNPSEG